MKRIILLLSSLLLSFSITFAQDNAILRFDEVNHDFGQILESNGDVSYTFTFKNQGNVPLIISRVQPSCGCTTPEWTKEPIAPGKSGYVKATYSVQGRIGPFSKSVAVYSNDKDYTTLIIKGEVLKEKPNVTALYPIEMGDLRLKANKIDLNVVKNTDTKTESIEVYNDGKEPVSLSFGKYATYVSATAIPATIQPGNSGRIEITYKGFDVKSYGIQNAAIPLLANNVQKAGNIISIQAKVVDDFAKMTQAQMQSAPRLNINPSYINLTSGKGNSQLLKIANSGKTNLIIRSIKADTDAIVITGGKTEVEPGEIVEFNVSVQPKKLSSELNAQINIVTNDPKDYMRDIRVTVKK